MSSKQYAAEAVSSSCSEPNFGHIYYADWQYGATYERKTKNGIINLGKLVDKELTGRTYDQDIVLTFESTNGTKYTYTMVFDNSYRLVKSNN